MKLKGILSGVISATMAIASITATAYASEAVNFEALPATDFNDNIVTTLTGGDLIKLPIDITTKDGNVSQVQFEITYNPEILTLGINAEKNMDNEDLVAEYSDKYDRLALSGDQLTMYGGRDIVVSKNPLTGKITYDLGSSNFAVVSDPYYNGSTNVVRVSWQTSNDGGYAVTDVPEFYLYFTVNDGVNINDDNFNTSYIQKLFVISAEAGEITNDSKEYDGTYNKLNPCDGAFQVVVDTAELVNAPVEDGQTGYYVQDVKAKIADATIQGVNGDTISLNACVDSENTLTDPASGVVNTGTYYFPVRLTSDAETESVEVEIIATVSDDESGNNSREVSWGTVKVDMNGTATTYADKNAVE